MNSDAPIDNRDIMVDNTTDDEYEIVKMDEQEPINDTNCTHENLIPDPEDTIGDAVYHGCSNKKCGIGFYINKKL